MPIEFIAHLSVVLVASYMIKLNYVSKNYLNHLPRPMKKGKDLGKISRFNNSTFVKGLIPLSTIHFNSLGIRSQYCSLLVFVRKKPTKNEHLVDHKKQKHILVLFLAYFFLINYKLIQEVELDGLCNLTRTD
ncbi:unnamed protein product [Coffea canephora]|uniref:DH200=94 genomic scaffold, scaffold_823 n=1 Tax=Coffea canephora TaxID=49390 RepID=A0A068VHB6_COFCA|nr:unnamed protein product [Coffea canephora]